MLLNSVAQPAAMQKCRVVEKNAKIMVFSVSFSSKNAISSFVWVKSHHFFSNLEYVP